MFIRDTGIRTQRTKKTELKISELTEERVMTKEDRAVCRVQKRNFFFFFFFDFVSYPLQAETAAAPVPSLSVVPRKFQRKFVLA